MSRFDSDMDYRDWAEDPSGAVERTCHRCGDGVLVSSEEPYRHQITVLCDRCHRLAMENQTIISARHTP